MTKEELYCEINKLEHERMAYLEIENKAGAKRKEKKIEELEKQIELMDLEKIKKELEAYKKVCANYPEIQMRIKEKLDE